MCVCVCKLLCVKTSLCKDFSVSKLGNRLTRRPCKGDEFETLIFEGMRQNVGICRSRQKNVCNMDINFDWQACDSRVKICVSPAR